MRDLKLDFFLDLSGHFGAAARAKPRKYLDLTADSREQSRPREIAADRNGNLLTSIQSVYPFSNVLVLVVQRKEQGFPKAKTVFLQESAAVIRTAQTAPFKRVE